MPIRFGVNGIELFKDRSKDIWASGPILSLACGGLLALQEAKNLGKTTYNILEGPIIIEFIMLDDGSIQIKHNEKKVIANYNELVEAFHNFADKIRKFIWERVPQLNNHPYWGQWLRGERE